MKKVIISGGGTGGHIYPAIAIAEEIKKEFPHAEILFVGAKGRMEMQKVPKAGYPIQGLWISGLQRKITWSNLLFPLKVLVSLWSSWRIIRSFHPDVVVGVGGYASGPLLYMAGRMKIPTLIHEQNSYAGLTNKWLSSRATCICVAYPGMEKFFPPTKIIVTGNPVREDILNISSLREKARIHFALPVEGKVVLVIGGSLGARTINESIQKSLPILQENNIYVIWQTGAGYFEKFKHCASDHFVVRDFIYEMNLAYAACDIVVSRAGASSIAEISIIGKPSVLIPSPWVAEDHQTHNAKTLTDKGAALFVSDREAQEGKLTEVILNLLNNEAWQQDISSHLQPFSMPDARARIVKELIRISHG